MDNMSKYWLCNYFEDSPTDDLPHRLRLIWNCSWMDMLSDPLISAVLSDLSEATTTLCPVQYEYVLSLAIACLQAFVQNNFTGPSLNAEQYAALPHMLVSSKSILDDILPLCSVDGEDFNVNMTQPELLIVAKILLEHLIARNDDHPRKFEMNWWYLRYLYVHQQILDEPTDSLYSRFLATSDALLQWHSEIAAETKALLLLEVVQGFLGYKRVWKAESHLNAVKQILEVSLEVKGILGKRTKHQQKALPQLALAVEMTNRSSREALSGAAVTHATTILPSLLQLDDDVRLEKITFELEEDNRQMEIPSVMQQLVLAILQFTLAAQPKDNLADEELTPYLTTLLYQTNGPWSSRITTLLLNISLESTHKRTVERSLKQCEEVNSMLTSNDGAAAAFQRLSLAYSAYIRPRWSVKGQLGTLMVSLGLVKTALELFMQLRKWSEVIACYNQLELRHKAAEIIQQEIDKQPTAELMCMLGDATDDVQCYERAWQLSGQRSGRAQRHWGLFFYDKKDYAAAIPHFQQSLHLNSLQDNVWLRLGYAALMLEDWVVAAGAYRRYTTIEPNGFESWNNLAKAYIQMGDKRRAHKVLQESLKCNFSNWKVWENFLLVSVDTGHFEDGINAYNQLIELRGKHYDGPVLQILAKSIARNAPDADGNATHRLLKKAQKLIGHLCVLYPSEALLWELGALLHPDEPLLQAQKLQKAFRCHTQTQSPWSKNPETCLTVLQLCENLCSTSLVAWQAHTDTDKAATLSQLSSARLSAQGCVRAATDEKWDNCTELLLTLTNQLDAIKDILLKR